MKVKHAPPNSCSWGFMKWADIPSKSNVGLVYLRRLRILQTPWFGVYLHWINEPDTDRYPHDHPWHFSSLIINGGYVEDVYEDPDNVGDAGAARYAWSRFSFHSMPRTKAHRIRHVTSGLVTLVFAGRRVRTWCFWTDDGLVEWKTYLKEVDAKAGEIRNFQ